MKTKQCQYFKNILSSFGIKLFSYLFSVLPMVFLKDRVPRFSERLACCVACILIMFGFFPFSFIALFFFFFEDFLFSRPMYLFFHNKFFVLEKKL